MREPHRCDANGPRHDSPDARFHLLRRAPALAKLAARHPLRQFRPKRILDLRRSPIPRREIRRRSTPLTHSWGGPPGPRGSPRTCIFKPTLCPPLLLFHKIQNVVTIGSALGKEAIHRRNLVPISFKDRVELQQIRQPPFRFTEV